MTRKSILDPNFKYDDSADTKSERNYLAAKWDKMFPGWNKKPQRGQEPTTTPRVTALRRSKP